MLLTDLLDLTEDGFIAFTTCVRADIIHPQEFFESLTQIIEASSFDSSTPVFRSSGSILPCSRSLIASSF
jgi:hypothetical protein